MGIVIKIILPLIFFALVIYFAINVRVTDNNEIKPSIIKAKIISIKKNYRGRCDLELINNNGNTIIAIDRNFREIRNIITIGDSIVKNDNDCPFFIHKDTLIERCRLEFFLP